MKASALMPLYSNEALRIRLARLNSFDATHLIPENIERVIAMKNRKGIEELGVFFRQTKIEIQREILVGTLCHQNKFSTRILSALSSVPRELLLGDTRFAYWNGVNLVNGLVAIPSPWLVAATLDLLQVGAGCRVLVLGLGGCHTSLVASRLVEDGGTVSVIEIDHELIERTRFELSRNSLPPIEIIEGDALDPELELGGIFDRIYASLSVSSVPKHWFRHLSSSGYLGVFLDNYDSGGKCKYVIFNGRSRARGSVISGLFNERFSSAMGFDGILSAERNVRSFFELNEDYASGR